MREKVTWHSTTRISSATVNGDVKFRAGLCAVDALFLEVHVHTEVFQHSSVFEAVDGVAGEAGNGLADDAVDLAELAIPQKPVEIISTAHVRACDSFIRIDVYKLILRVLARKIAVVSNLCGEGVKLIGGVA